MDADNKRWRGAARPRQSAIDPFVAAASRLQIHERAAFNDGSRFFISDAFEGFDLAVTDQPVAGLQVGLSLWRGDDHARAINGHHHHAPVAHLRLAEGLVRDI